MGIITILECIFLILFSVDFIASLFIHVKDKANKVEKIPIKYEDRNLKDKENDQGCLLELIIMFLAVIILVTIACVGFKYIPGEKIKWLLLIIAIIIIAPKIHLFLTSTKDFGKVINNESDRKLSVVEKLIVFKMGLLICLLLSYDLILQITDKVFNVVINYGETVGKILYITSYCILIYVIVFAICITVFDLSSIISMLLNKMKTISRRNSTVRKIIRFAKSIANRRDVIICPFINKLKATNNRIIQIIFCPIVILIDAILEALHLIVSLLEDGVAFLILLLLFVYDETRRLFGRLSRISQRRVMKVTFRFSLIIAVAITVIMNRTAPVFVIGRNATAVVEFVGSAIVIPLILESIIMLRRKDDS